MLRKFSKKNPSAKQSKRGVILVTILFILAISFVLITAAMLMTKGTRDRLYARAESSQARLTATAVAQAFHEAYSNHTLSEGAMSTILTSNRAGNPLTITAGPDLPGLTSAADNCTKLTVVPHPSLADTYWIDITTTIGTESSTVRLAYKPHQSGSHSATFQHQLQLGSGGRLENIVVGTTINTTNETYDNSTISMYPATNNTVLSLGGSTSWGGQTHIASTLYCDSTLGSGSNTQMYGDVVFFGSNSGLNLHGLSGSSFHGNNGSDLYFLDGGSSVIWYDSNSINSTNIDSYGHNNEWICGFDNVTFYNSGMHVQLNQNIQQSENYYSYNGAVTNPANDYTQMSFGNTDAESAWTSRFGDYNADTVSPTSTQTISMAVSDYLGKISAGHYNDPDPAARPNGKTYAQFLSDCNINTMIAADPSSAPGTPFPVFGTGNHTLTAGTYILGGSGASSLNIGNGNKVTCDLNSGVYIFYVQGDFTFKTGTIEFINGDIADVNHTAYFIIAQSASLRFIPYNVTVGSVKYPTGIVSANCFAPGAATQRKTIDQTAKPSVLVIGAGCSVYNRCLPAAGSDHVSDGQIYYYGNGEESILTAYVNLLPLIAPTTTTPASGYGSVCGGQGGNNMIFYGRLYCNQCYGGNGSCLVMPYCPAPNDTNNNQSVPVDNKYDIFGFSYYTV